MHCRYRLAGGEDAVVDRESASLREAGHDVESMVVHNPEGVRGTATALLNAPWNRRAAEQVRSRAVAQQPDVVHVHNTWFALSPAVLPALSDAGFPSVQTVHNHRLLCVNAELFRDGRPCYDCVGRSPWPGVQHRCYRGSATASSSVAVTIQLARRRHVYEGAVDALITPSARARELLIAGGLPPQRLHVVPNSVLDPGPRAAPPSSSTTVLYAGRLVPSKGVDVLLQAWAHARPDGLVLEVAGEGELAAQAQATPGVRLLGKLPPARVAQHMRAARAVLVPSVFDEPFGLVAIEAFSTGTPVLASRSGALPELLVAAGNDHWLVESGGWDAALLRLVDGYDLDEAGARGRAAYERLWTPQRALERLLDVYASVRRRD